LEKGPCSADSTQSTDESAQGLWLTRLKRVGLLMLALSGKQDCCHKRTGELNCIWRAPLYVYVSRFGWMNNFATAFGYTSGSITKHEHVDFSGFPYSAFCCMCLVDWQLARVTRQRPTYQAFQRLQGSACPNSMARTRDLQIIRTKA